MNFRKQSIHTSISKYIELARRTKDEEMEIDMTEVRKYINHLEARCLGLEKTKDGLLERLEKRYGKY